MPPSLGNVWLPWSLQAIKAGDAPTLLINVKGKGRASVNVVATPWLAYGCSVGARLKTSFGCATVVEVRVSEGH